MPDALSNFAWPSPAKLNLFLHINGKRQDGYHELQSLFQILDYGDTLFITPSVSPNIVLNSQIDGVKDEDNLVFKAAKLLQDHCQITQGCEITIEKRLPMGGGIGGGSSNAATTLVALNHLWQTKLGVTELMQLGLKLGADVPVFINGKTAFAEGVGEQLTSFAQPEKFYLVVNPDVHVATASIFGNPNLPRQTPKIHLDEYSFEQTKNDCQELVLSLYPDIANSLRWLLQYAPSRMTGTGCCVFAVFDTKELAQQVLEKLPENLNGFVAKGCDISPLLDALEKSKSTFQIF